MKRRPYNIVWFALALIFAGTASGLRWHLGGKDHVWQVPFESAAWKRADPIDGDRTVRSAMIEDLLRKNNFRGWSRTDVENLLGPPAPGEGKEYGFSQFHTIYLLGLERQGAFSLDDEVLGFVFDVDDKVVAYGVSVN